MTGRHIFLMLLITGMVWYFNPFFGFISATICGIMVFIWYKAEGKRLDEAAREDVRKHKRRVRDYRNGVIHIPDEE